MQHFTIPQNVITATEANAIQAEWMALQSDAPKAEKQRVFALMEKLPQHYISCTPEQNGLAQVMQHGMPSHSRPEPIGEAILRAQRMGVQTSLVWAGNRWEAGK